MHHTALKLLAVTLNIYFLILSNIILKHDGCIHLVSLYFQCYFPQSVFLIHSANLKDPLSEVGFSFSHTQVPTLVVMCSLLVSLILKYTAYILHFKHPFIFP